MADMEFVINYLIYNVDHASVCVCTVCVCCSVCINYYVTALRWT